MSQIAITNGFGISKADAIEAQRVLEEIRQAHGGNLRDPDIVAHARNASSPLHKHFTWDTRKGFERNLLREAAELRRKVKYIIIDSPKMPKPRGSFYVSVTDEESASRIRIPITDVVESEVWRMEYFIKARDDLKNWTRRYQTVVELMNARSKVELVIEELEQMIDERPTTRRTKRRRRVASR